MSRTLSLLVALVVVLGDAKAFMVTQYLIGNWKPNVGEFPHMAALGRSACYTSPCCGPTHLGNHGVESLYYKRGPPTVIRLGEYDLSTEDDSDHQDVAVAEIILHPRYNWVQVYNDIALIRLNETVQYSRFIRPACLWKLEALPVEANGQLTAIGWGKLGHYGDQPTELHKVDLPVISNDECNRVLSSIPKSRRLNESILPSQICAGDLSGKKDTCEGDSGGPLFLRSSDPNCNYDVVGIISSGFICGTVRRPGVYTRVSYYISWIESTMQQMLDKLRKY